MWVGVSGEREGQCTEKTEDFVCQLKVSRPYRSTERRSIIHTIMNLDTEYR